MIRSSMHHIRRRSGGCCPAVGSTTTKVPLAASSSFLPAGSSSSLLDQQQLVVGSHHCTMRGLCMGRTSATTTTTSPRTTGLPQNSYCDYSPTSSRFSTAASDPTTGSDSESDEHDDATPAITNKKKNYAIARRAGVRNVAIIAHVDHGKTTLVDKLLWTTRELVNDNSSSDLNRLMDSGDLEKERGITITSKVTRLSYASSATGEPIIINVVDTPGHADFSGEVDRILSMVDGVCLLVDAGEGPMTQTKYVLSRSLALGLRPLVVLNKVDRPSALARLESGETESDVLDLFDALGATDEQMDYPTLYGSARDGWTTADLEIAHRLGTRAAEAVAASSVGKQPQRSSSNDESPSSHNDETSMKVLLDAIVNHVPEPAIRHYKNTNDDDDDNQQQPQQPFALAAVTVGMDSYMGRTCTGRIVSGSIALNDKVQVIPRDGPVVNTNTTTLGGIFVNRGISRTPLESGRAYAGDIVTLVGVPDHMAVGDTLTSVDCPIEEAIVTPPVAPPTLSMEFGANTGPLAGTEGTIVTSSKVRERLFQETDNNVTLSVEGSETDSEKTVVLARGELQLGILAEQMRREGFELMISPPRILTKTCPETNQKLEPFEEVIVDVDSEYSGTVVSALTGNRKAILMEMTENADGKTRLLFEAPSRGLLGFSSEIATATKGTAVVNHCFLEDRPYAGQLGLESARSKIVSTVKGKATSFALENLVKRGTLFIAPGDMVYEGMIIGESAKARDIDMDVNPTKSKELTNMRTVAKDEKIALPPPKRMTVEELIGYMGSDEIIEVTPLSVRLRKAELDPKVRARSKKGKKPQT